MAPKKVNRAEDAAAGKLLREEVLLRLRTTEKDLPYPLRLGNTQVTVTPLLWVVVFDRAFGEDGKANLALLRSPAGVEGPLLQSFRAALIQWLNRVKEGTSQEKNLLRLISAVIDQFVALGEAVAEPTAKPPHELLEVLEGRLQRAVAAVDVLITEYLRLTEGDKYSNAFSRRRRLDAGDFPLGYGDTFVKLSQMAPGKDDVK
jgi:hypothetical protein